MKLKEIIRVIKPEYVFIKLTPNNSIRNNGTYKIAKAIASLYKNIRQNITKDEARLIKMFGRQFLFGTKYTFYTPSKTAYFIYLEKKKAEFYFIVPKKYLSVVREKMTDAWKGVTISEAESFPLFKQNATKYQMVYTKEDPLSLENDLRNNNLLDSILNVIDILDEHDRVGVFYNFIPASQFSWRSVYRNTLVKVRNKSPVDRNKFGMNYILMSVISFAASTISDLGEIIGGKSKKKTEENTVTLLESAFERLGGLKQVSDATTKKGNETVVDTQIIVFSESPDGLKELNNAKSLVQSFDAISGDNTLKGKPYKHKGAFDPTALRINNVEVNKVSTTEASNFIALPGHEILMDYGFIEKIETKETEVPEDLRKGVMRVGINTFRGNKQMAHLTTHPEYQHLSTFLIGPTRSGKTTLIGNMSYDAIMNGECVILVDYIENCEMSSQVASLFSSDKVLNIVCDDPAKSQGLGYNEVKFSLNPAEQYINAKRQTTQLKTLVNSINADDTGLTARMTRFLSSAALVVFLNAGSIKDVFSVLQNHNQRRSFLDKVQKSQKENMAEYVDYLHELDDVDKDGKVTGTKLHLVEGIVSRLNKLKDNPYMESMLKKGTENNVDLVVEMQKNQLICIKMPEDMFNTDEERDVYTTYWMTKIWLALQIRAKTIPDKDNRKKVNLFIDEIYQVQTTEAFLTELLSRFAKFRLKPIVSCHYLSQLKHMKKVLGGANASYMLISGCDKDNFMELKEELHPFEVEDLLNLPEHHSMNYLKSKGGFARFITKLPPPVGKMKIEEGVTI